MLLWSTFFIGHELLPSCESLLIPIAFDHILHHLLDPLILVHELASSLTTTLNYCIDKAKSRFEDVAAFPL